MRLFFLGSIPTKLVISSILIYASHVHAHPKVLLFHLRSKISIHIFHAASDIGWMFYGPGAIWRMENGKGLPGGVGDNNS